MAYDGWIGFNGVEIANLSRTALLADALGISSVRLRPSDYSWIQAEVGTGFGLGPFGLTPFGGIGGSNSNYHDITSAPWYDAGYPPSTEFAGVLPLAIDGLDDSSRVSTTIEYVTDGGSSGRGRNETLPIVFSVALVASTSRGAEYGKRWLQRVLRGGGASTFCSGSDLIYFRYGSAGAPVAHRRDVSLTRAPIVTRKREAACSVIWTLTFTLTANDPYEYGEAQSVLTELSATGAVGDSVLDSGSLVLTQNSCPVWDYSPVFDPMYPALVATPSAPDFYPDGWDIVPGMTFERFWARVPPVEPSSLNTVPMLRLESDSEARLVRVGIWPSDSDPDDQCDPLFLSVVSYLPQDVGFYIDGEQKASYIWDGGSPVVRRTDSLVYGPDASPVQWSAFNDSENLLITLDLFTGSSGYAESGDVRLAVDLVPKSD